MEYYEHYIPRLNDAIEICCWKKPDAIADSFFGSLKEKKDVAFQSIEDFVALSPEPVVRVDQDTGHMICLFESAFFNGPHFVTWLYCLIFNDMGNEGQHPT